MCACVLEWIKAGKKRQHVHKSIKLLLDITVVSMWFVQVYIQATYFFIYVYK
jgi:hypothetical protein